MDLVIIDQAIASPQQLAEVLSPAAEVLLIGPQQDLFALLHSTISGRRGIRSLHLIGHGASGQMQLGSTLLTTELVQANETRLAALAKCFEPGADLMLYGCETGQGTKGKQLMRSLSRALQVDVLHHPIGQVANREAVTGC